MAIVDGGYSSGTWGEAGWGLSVYYPLVSNGGWGNGPWGSDGWGLGNGGLITASDQTNVVASVPVTVFINESVNVSDVVINEPGVSETVVGTDQVSAAPAFDVLISETATINDLVSSLSAIPNNIEESVIAVDSFDAFNTILLNIIEAANTSTTVASLAQFGATVTETMSAVEQDSAVGDNDVTLQNSAVASDITTSRFLWEFVDDSQNVSWQIINTIM